MERRAVPFTPLTAEGRVQLESLARAQSLAAALERRVQMILQLVGGEATKPVPKTCLARRLRCHLDFPPTDRSWVHEVVRWSALITHQAGRRGSFDSLADIRPKIHIFGKHCNRHARPFLWIAAASRSAVNSSCHVKLPMGTSLGDGANRPEVR